LFAERSDIFDIAVEMLGGKVLAFEDMLYLPLRLVWFAKLSN
jgi:hypothetical protein